VTPFRDGAVDFDELGPLIDWHARQSAARTASFGVVGGHGEEGRQGPCPPTRKESILPSRATPNSAIDPASAPKNSDAFRPFSGCRPVSQ